MKDVKLGVPRKDTGESAVGVNDICSNQPLDGFVVPKDEDVFPVILEKMMFFESDDVIQ